MTRCPDVSGLLSGYSRKYCPNNPEYAPGERWEIEFADNDVRIEKFRSDGNIYNKDELENLFQQFSD